MSTVIIIGSGGGHHAVKYLAQTYPDMTAQEKADAVTLLRNFVESVNERYGQSFDTTRL